MSEIVFNGPAPEDAPEPESWEPPKDNRGPYVKFMDFIFDKFDRTEGK